MRRIGIIGGSFDPIHNGHLHLAEEARCMAKLDQVLFIPTWVSPFKQASSPASCKQRLDMVRIAISSNPGFAVSDMEIQREEVSYTADTLRRCKAMMGEETRLYFITGTDAFLSIEQWYQAEELLTRYSFIIGSRPGYREEDLDQVIRRVQTKYGTDILKIEIPRLEISSSDIRQNIQRGKSVRYLLPDPLVHYIERHRLYLEPVINPSHNTEKELPYEEIDRDIDEVIRGRLKATRLAHTYGVVETAVTMAKRFGADPRKARTCALFHDAFREVGNLAHGAVAADYMEEEFGIDDEDMLNAVRFHTTGRKGMTLLEKILFLADAIEPNRKYPCVDELRAMAEHDLDKACLMSLTRTIDYVKSQGQDLDPRTLEAAEDLKYRMDSGNPLKKGDSMNNREIALLAAKAMDDRKGQDVVILDVAQRASFADYLVIASGMTDRLVAALCDEVEDRLAKEGIFVKNTEGKGNTGWILMDFGDVIVNVFTEEKRAHYNIERLWGDCPRVEFEPIEE